MAPSTVGPHDLHGSPTRLLAELLAARSANHHYSNSKLSQTVRIATAHRPELPSLEPPRQPTHGLEPSDHEWPIG